jgi:SAM-dependent methyltransferase
MILKLVSKIFKKGFVQQEQSEADYYNYLFTQNPEYSGREPNLEEQERWMNIKILLDRSIQNRGSEVFDTIIDFGCGRGWLSNYLSSYGSVTSIEPVEKVIEHARKLYPNLDFHVGSFEILRKYKAFLVVSSEVIEHFQPSERESYFVEIYNSLVPLGYFIITTPRREKLKEWSKFSDPSQPVEEWLTENELLNLAEKAGFHCVDNLRYSIKPTTREDSPLIEIYQQWLFQRK